MQGQGRFGKYGDCKRKEKIRQNLFSKPAEIKAPLSEGRRRRAKQRPAKG